ncbi:MAG: hypothetical protein COA44_13910 [Arcobacter sp.]|nr:MAG: hypothetical protein COA44_13910 [Arcobacter sp.]
MNSTLKYYEDNALAFIQNTLDKKMDIQYEYFLKDLRPKSHILDAGCGSGRDSLYFKKQGYTITAFDISKKMCDFASNLLDQEVLELSFESMDFKDRFDAIWASASLLHISKKNMPSVLQKLARAIKPEGLIYASFKAGEEEFIKEERHFNSYSKQSFSELIKTSPFTIKEVYLLEDTRPNKEGEFWLNTLLVLK